MDGQVGLWLDRIESDELMYRWMVIGCMYGFTSCILALVKVYQTIQSGNRVHNKRETYTQQDRSRESLNLQTQKQRNHNIAHLSPINSILVDCMAGMKGREVQRLTESESEDRQTSLSCRQSGKRDKLILRNIEICILSNTQTHVRQKYAHRKLRHQGTKE